MTSRLVTICLLLQVATPSAIAQMVTKATLPAVSKKYSLSSELTYSSNLLEDTAADRSRDLYLNLRYTYDITKHAKLRVASGIEQNLVADTKTSVTNTQVTLSRNPVELNETWSFRYGLFANLPTNEDDRKLATLRGGTGISLGMDQKAGLFGKPTTIKYGISGLKNYHEYDRTNMRAANISHRMRYSLGTLTKLNQKFSFELSSYYQTGWTYDGTMRTQFSLSETLNYALNKNTDVYVSHLNIGNALRANGLDSNIALYDKNASTIEIGLLATY